MTANVVVTERAPQHLIDQAHEMAAFVQHQFGVHTITVHEDHVTYHDMCPANHWDAQLAKFTRYNGEDVLRTEVDKPVTWDQTPKANAPKKRKKK
jgi:hypothetical protein